MTTITTRSGKGSPLTNNEVDANFTNLNTDKYESGDTASFGGLTLTNANPSLYITANTTNWAALDISAGGNQANYIFFRDEDAERARISVLDGNDMIIGTGASTTERIRFSASGTIVNDNSADQDFRVESNTNTHALFVDAGNDSVSIGDSDGSLATLQVRGEVGGSIFRLFSGTSYQGLQFQGTTSLGNGTVEILPVTIPGSGTANQYTYFNKVASGGTTKHHVVVENSFQVDDGEAVFNQSGGDNDFRVESDSNTHMLFVDGGNNRVGINTSSPNAPLHVQTSHTSSDVTAANSNITLNVANSGTGNGVYNNIKFSGNQQDMYIMSFNNSTQANRRIGFFVGSVAGDAIDDERFIIKGDGDVAVVNELAAPTNSASNPGKFRIQGQGWNTATGNRDQGWSLQSTGTYSARKSGQVYPDLAFNALTTDAVYNDTTVAKFYYDGVGYRFQVDAGAVFNESSLDSDFRVESDGNTHMLFVDAGNNRVGIGDSSPDVALSVVTGGSNEQFHVQSPTPGMKFIDSTLTTRYFTIGGENGHISIHADPGSAQSDSHILMKADGSTIARFDGDGLKFGSDTAAANALDDYEEGTWTPVINSGTISATEATYTKIGNVVTLRANIADFSDNTTATDINISGLPFTTSSTNRAVGSCMFRYFSKTNMAQVTPYIGQSRTFLEFYVSFNANATWTPLQFNDGAQANMDLIFSITYIA